MVQESCNNFVFKYKDQYSKIILETEVKHEYNWGYLQCCDYSEDQENVQQYQEIL